MIRAYRLVYDDPNALPHLWEWEQPAIDHLVRNAYTFSQRVVQRSFSTWQTLAGENSRRWDTHDRCSPMYQPWETLEAGLAEYRALVLEVQGMAEAQHGARRHGRRCHETIGEESRWSCPTRAAPLTAQHGIKVSKVSAETGRLWLHERGWVPHLPRIFTPSDRLGSEKQVDMRPRW